MLSIKLNLMESSTERSFKMILDERSVSDFLTYNPKEVQRIKKLYYTKTTFIFMDAFI